MGDGVETTADVVFMLLLFYGLPLLVAAVPTAGIVWLVTRAWRRRRQHPDERRPDARLAGWWFAGVALLPVLLFNLTIGLPSWMILLLGPWSSESVVELRYALFVVVVSVAPVLAAWGAGHSLGGPIVRVDTTSWSAAGRGMLVAVIAMLVLGLVMWLDVLTTDYSDAIETSPERGHALVQGAMLVLLPPVLALGALAGWGLRRLSLGRTVKRETVSQEPG